MGFCIANSVNQRTCPLAQVTLLHCWTAISMASVHRYGACAGETKSARTVNTCTASHLNRFSSTMALTMKQLGRPAVATHTARRSTVRVQVSGLQPPKQQCRHHKVVLGAGCRTQSWNFLARREHLLDASCFYLSFWGIWSMGQVQAALAHLQGSSFLPACAIVTLAHSNRELSSSCSRCALP